MGLAWDSADRLWFSSDATGEIFVLEQVNGTGTDGGGDGNGGDGNGGDGNGGNGNGNGNGTGNGKNAASGLTSERHGTAAVAQAAVLAGLLLA